MTEHEHEQGQQLGHLAVALNRASMLLREEKERSEALECAIRAAWACLSMGQADNAQRLLLAAVEPVRKP